MTARRTLSEVAWALVLALACARCGTPTQQVSPPDISFLGDVDPTRWVTTYDPERAWGSYTLMLYRNRIPILFDMNGRIVHAWPEARVHSRVRLLQDGTLLGLGRGRTVVEYSWDGRLTWEARFLSLPHHDIIRLENGNTMLPVLRTDKLSDDILELDRSGETVWVWHSHEHLADRLDLASGRKDQTHINSIRELPSNRWFDAGDARFRPGNLLVSARNLDMVFVIDRETKEVVWEYAHELDRQHEAVMIPPTLPNAGNIQLFDNGSENRFRYRASRVIEIDPTTTEIKWQFATDGFYSSTVGLEQPLPNGNVFVASTRGFRVFEVDRSGRIVWEWSAPFQPHRPSRIPYDHCPQLAALGRPIESAVRPRPDHLHVSPQAHAFGSQRNIARVRIDGVKRSALVEPNLCKRVFVPNDAEVWLGYGLNSRAAAKDGRSEYSARFRVLAARQGGPPEALFDRTVTLESNWYEDIVPLDQFAGTWIELCLSLESDRNKDERELAYWHNPVIRRRSARPLMPQGEIQPPTAEEADAERQRLEALGYLN